MQWRVNTQYRRTLKDTPYCLVYGMHPRVGISNLPILQNIISNLVTEAQLNEVYCEMAEDPPSQDTAKLPQSFQDQVAAVVDAANDEAMVSLSPVQTKRRKRPPEDDSNTSMMDLTRQAKMRDARDMKIAKRDALKEAVLSNPVENPISPPAQKELRVPLFLIAGWNYLKSEMNMIDLSPYQKFKTQTFTRCFRSYTASTTRTSQTMTTGRHVF